MGRQTRKDTDLDLAVAAGDVGRATEVLTARGFSVIRD
jgi:hypothetical protein